MSDTPDGMPEGLTPDPRAGDLDVKKTLAELAKRDIHLSKQMSRQLKEIASERKIVRQQIEKQQAQIKKSGLSEEDAAASVKKLATLLDVESHRLDKETRRTALSFQDELAGYEKRTVTHNIEVAKSTRKTNKEFLGDLKKTLSDSLEEGTKNALAETADTMLGPLKLITRPLEELTGVNFKSMIGDIIGKKQDARRAIKESRTRTVSIYDDDEDYRSPKRDADARGGFDGGHVDVMKITVGKALIKVDRAGMMSQPDAGEAPLLGGGGAMSLPAPEPRLLLTDNAGMESEASEKDLAVLKLLSPGQMTQPKREKLLQSGVIGTAAVYIGDMLKGDELGGKDKKKESKSDFLGDLTGIAFGDILAKMLPKMLEKLLPALIAAIPEILAAGVVIAAIAAIVADTEKRNKERDAKLASLTDEDKAKLAKKGIDTSQIFSLEQANAAVGLAGGTAGSTVAVDPGQLMAGNAKNGRAILGATIQANNETSAISEATGIISGHSYNKKGSFFWLDPKTSQIYVSNSADNIEGAVPLSTDQAKDADLIKSIMTTSGKSKSWDKLDKMQGDFLGLLSQAGGKPVKFARGGTVPGATGQPQMVQAEGGETMVPSHDPTFRENLDLLLDPATKAKIQGGRGLRSSTRGDQEVADATHESAVVEIDDSFNDKVVEAIETLTAVVKSGSRSAPNRMTSTVGNVNFDAFRGRANP